ncbi:peroxide stress protein YaaA [Helicobacter sp. MIT 14-3879]|uniref:peroxide stress protein YaaA n=1 Tax=Helicobacter sp. MIT 14-3879 TaxID=2040649 RepID=UPI000E1EAACA|nr:peroxide stress protein YaaA [Helicobacter sp. MIT 14-3879]RDU58868.1 peroxide stress protein YaaA [Helicobacter sp. MIT 14-3879]
MAYCILLSPSEDKLLHTHNSNSKFLESYKKSVMQPNFLTNLWEGKELLTHREKLCRIYIDYLRQTLENSDSKLLLELYGARRFHAKNEYELNIALNSMRSLIVDSISQEQQEVSQQLMPAIIRYCGVAFDSLNFEYLESHARQTILEKTLIFSNLFGVIKASDKIPFYKLKQGTKLEYLTLQEVYKPFIPLLESHCKEWDFLIDLRSHIYAKIWSPHLMNEKKFHKPHFFFEFYKGGKVISHYAKLYRGKILAMFSSQNKDKQSISANEALKFFSLIHNETLYFVGSIENKGITLLQYEIR